MDALIAVLVIYALTAVFCRFVAFHVRNIVKIIQRFNLRKVRARERLTLELNNLCTIPCYRSCCDSTSDLYIPFTRDEQQQLGEFETEAAFARRSIPRGV